MEVRGFDPDEHFRVLKGWLILRGFKESEIGDIPSHGVMAFKDGYPIAAIFLRQAEGGYGWIEGLTTNPLATREERHEGIEEVVKAIIDLARNSEFKMIYAFSTDNGTLMRSSVHGFVKLPHTLIGLDLGERDGIHFKANRRQEQLPRDASGVSKPCEPSAGGTGL